MLLVDYRDGSKDLIRPLQKLGLEVEETDLEFGDIAFVGRGIGGKPVQVGIEFKKLSECIGSLRTERLQGHQAPGMQDAYDFRWLLVEGELHIDRAGLLQRRVGKREFKPIPGRMTLSEYNRRLLSMHLCWGLNPERTDNTAQTMKWIEACYRSWTDVDQDKHTSHLGIYQPPTLVPISDFRRAVCSWPTIGIRTSKAVEDHFKYVSVAAVAGVSQWAEIEVITDAGKPRRIGTKDAEKIVAFLRGKS